MTRKTIFDGQKVVFDAMVIINFHGLLALDKLVNWAKGDIVIEKYLKEKEIKYSKAGPIILEKYIKNGSMMEVEITSKKETDMFYQVLKTPIGKTTIHKGEAACLALAMGKGYGLASDEKAVREEFKRKCPDKICVSSWMIVDKAIRLGMISKKDGEDLKKGFYFV
jgi:predicted nucleic acid-binding protein